MGKSCIKTLKSRANILLRIIHHYLKLFHNSPKNFPLNSTNNMLLIQVFETSNIKSIFYNHQSKTIFQTRNEKIKIKT